MFNTMLKDNLAMALEVTNKNKKVFFKKIEIPKLLQMLCNIITNNSPSLRDISLEYFMQYNVKVSKQSFYYLFENHLLSILMEVIQVLLFKTEHNSLSNKPIYFKRILLQDSIAIKLPDNASEKYSGMANKKGCKVQTTFDVLSNCFTNLFITPFTVNDQKYSHEIKNNITANDLIIRDLGYFTSAALNYINDIGAFFLSRIPAGTKVFNKEGKEINLLHYLDKKGEIDEILYIVKKSKIRVRIIAKRISEEKANRRRYIKKRESKHNPSKNCLALLSWDIVVCNIFDKTIESKTIFDLYRLRWKIEIIFKTWKSHCQIHNFHERISEKQIRIYLLIRLLTIILTNDISAKLMPYANPKKGNHKLSYLSLMKHLLNKIDKIVYTNCRDSLIKLIAKIIPYSYYEKRNRVTLLDVELSILQDLSGVVQRAFIP